MNTKINSNTKFIPSDLIFNFNLRHDSKNRLIQTLTQEWKPEVNVEVNCQQSEQNNKTEQQKWKIR